MKFQIEHVTEYRFSRPVFLEPHQLRFSPRTDGAQQRLNFLLETEPPPAGVTEILDPEGNLVRMVWFDGLHERLRTRALSLVETCRENPFDYLLTKQARKLPVDYTQVERSTLAASCQRDKVSSGADPIVDMVRQICQIEEGRLLPCLNRLNQTIYERFEVIRREQGDPWAPAATFEMQRGACRDLAVLFVDACRAWGLAARFVSSTR